MSRFRKRSEIPLRGMAPLLVGLVLWQLLGNDRSVTYPPPLSWFSALVGLFEQGELRPAITHTLQSFAASLILATLAGFLVGAALGAQPRTARASSLLLEILRNTPPAALFPIVAVLWGTGFVPAMAFVSFATFWPIVLNTSSGIRSMNDRLDDVSGVFSLNGWEKLAKLQLPAVLPNSLVGVRLAAPLALIFTLFVEMMTNSGGLGSLLLTAQQNYTSAQVYGIVFILAVLGLGLNLALVQTQHRLSRRWPNTLSESPTGV